MHHHATLHISSWPKLISPGQAHQQGTGQLSRADRVPARRAGKKIKIKKNSGFIGRMLPSLPNFCAATGNLLHDNYSFFGGSVHVHVVHTCPSPADDLQIVGSIDDVGRNLCCRSHHEAVVLLQGENHGPSFQPSKGSKSDLTRVTHVTHMCAAARL